MKNIERNRTVLLIFIVLIFFISIFISACNSNDSIIGKWSAVSINGEEFNGTIVEYEFQENNIAYFNSILTGTTQKLWFKIEGNNLYFSAAEEMPSNDDEWIKNTFKLTKNELIINQDDTEFVFERIED